jgi:hypothetical protein
MKTTKNRFLHTAVLAVTGLALLVGCNRDPLKDLSPDDSQVFITNHDRSVDFSTYKTFSIVDSVAVLSNQGADRPSATSRELAFIARIAQNLTQRGYVRVARTEKPDLGINVARINNSYLGVVANPNPYYGGFGGGYWGYGGYGGYYPSTYSYYQVNENYWYTEALDLKNPRTGQNGQNQLAVIWTAEIRGDNIFNDASINQVVDAVFAQSGYFQAGK